jgi:hypothetical protein
MISAEDELKIFQNILAQSPKGLADPELIGKFARAKATLHAFDSMDMLQSQMMPPTQPQPDQNAQLGQNNAISDTIAPQSTNTPPQTQEGQGSLKLP